MNATVPSGRLVIRGSHELRVVDLGPQPVVIGRAPGACEVVLIDSGVSRRHARIEPTPEGHRVVDLDSSNGTFVNERRVEATDLSVFDQVRVGDHVLIYLDARASTAHEVLDVLTPHEAHGAGPLTERLVGVGLYLHDEAAGAADGMSVVREVTDELMAATGHTRALLIAESPGGSFEVVHAQGLPPEALEDVALQPLRGVVLAAQASPGTREAPTPLDLPGEPARTLCVALDSRPAMAEPRRRRSWDVRGALLLAGRAAPWSPSTEEQRLLRGLARQLAVLVSGHWLERQATQDPLTGLPNRGTLERALIDALDRARAAGGAVGVVMLDVDDFKRVNDAHGHAVGDEALRHVGASLRAAIRGSDLAGRWGGEEFLVVLPGEGLDGTAAAAQKLVRAVAAAPSPGHGVQVTVSAGVAASPPHAADSYALVACADMALYAAKRAGKNRAVVHDSGLGSAAAAYLGQTTELTMTVDRRALRAADVHGWWLCDLLPPTPLRAGTLTIGRDPDSDLILHAPAVSRRHAKLVVTPDGRVTFVDCSTNGSRVNGLPHSGARELGPGDVVTIGPYQLLLRREGLDRRDVETARVPP